MRLDFGSVLLGGALVACGALVLARMPGQSDSKVVTLPPPEPQRTVQYCLTHVSRNRSYCYETMSSCLSHESSEPGNRQTTMCKATMGPWCFRAASRDNRRWQNYCAARYESCEARRPLERFPGRCERLP